jgi:hypothetical protein
MMTKNAHETAKETLGFQKGTFTCWWDAMSILQDQAALAADKILNQSGLISDEGRQVLSNWIGTCKNERDRYKVYMEESFSVLEKHLAQNTKGAPARPDKPAAEAKKAAPAIKPEVDTVKEEKSPEAHEIKQSDQ